jgi:hypothetical protein
MAFAQTSENAVEIDALESEKPPSQIQEYDQPFLKHRDF